MKNQWTTSDGTRVFVRDMKTSNLTKALKVMIRNACIDRESAFIENNENDRTWRDYLPDVYESVKNEMIKRDNYDEDDIENYARDAEKRAAALSAGLMERKQNGSGT